MDIERRLPFPDAKLSLRLDEDSIIISTDKFARSIVLAGEENDDNFGWRFDDNYFDLLPGEEKRVALKGSHRKGTVSAKPFYSPNTTSIEWSVRS